MMSALDPAAKLLRHGLLAVADAEHRDAGLVNGHRGERCVLVEHRSRAAGENDRLRLQCAQRFFGLLKRRDLAINLLFTHASRDQLGDLRAEIDDENLVVGRHGGFYGNLFALSSIAGKIIALRRLVTPQHADEKAVGIGPARRHQEPLIRDKHRAREKIGALA